MRRPRQQLGFVAFLALIATASSCLEQNPNRVEVSSTDCILCHTAQYEAVAAPPHTMLAWTECWRCHVETAWRPAVPIDHGWYILRFRHAETPCAACHVAGYQPGLTPTTCIGCHQAAFDAAAAPPHLGFDTDCAACHTEAGWRPSSFVHPMRLDGAHALAPCTSCHTGDPPTWRGLPTTCIGCHQADYDASPFPGHTAFPTTCADCHSTTAWIPALEGPHPEAQFPITEGPHKKYVCLDCHDPTLGPSASGANTDCIGCHDGAHLRSSADADHRGVSGYPLGGTSVNFCLDCHPRGE